jgi:hypothetical protein
MPGSDARALAHVHNIAPDAANRANNDFYKTPTIAIEKLLAHETFNGHTLEPACGDGAISKVFAAAGLAMESRDLVDRGYGTPGRDFLTTDFADDIAAGTYQNIITNPPFHEGMPEKFLFKALPVATEKVVLLLRLLWLEGSRRKKRIFDVCPPSRVYVFGERVNVTRNGDPQYDGKRSMVAFAWYVWDKTAIPRQPTQLFWI